jgi:hypothetical protein
VVDKKWTIEQNVYEEDDVYLWGSNEERDLEQELKKATSHALMLLFERDDVKAICVSPYDSLPELQFRGETTAGEDSLSNHIATILIGRYRDTFPPFDNIAGRTNKYSIESERDHDIVIFFAKTQLPCARACKEIIADRKRRIKIVLEGLLFDPLMGVVASYLE